MARFAANSEVPGERSRAEIEQILIRNGADQFMTGWRGSEAVMRDQLKRRETQLRQEPIGQESKMTNEELEALEEWFDVFAARAVTMPVEDPEDLSEAVEAE